MRFDRGKRSLLAGSYVIGLTFLLFGTEAAHAEQPWGELVRDGSRAITECRYTDAENIFLRMLRQLQDIPESDSRVADTLHELGVVYLLECKYADAERFCRRAVDLRQQKLGNAVPTARSELVLSTVYRMLGRYSDSYTWIKRALAIFDSQPGLAREELGAPYHGLALTLLAERRYAEAERAALRALDAWPQSDVANLANRADVISTLANLYAFRHDFVRSAQFHSDALSTLERAYGYNHPRLILPLVAFGLFQLSRANYSQAEQLARRAVSIAEASVGPQHRDWANASLLLASTLTRMGRHDDARDLYARALEVIERLAGTESVAFAFALRDYGVFLRLDGRIAEAKTAELRSRTILGVRRETVDVMELNASRH